MSNPASSSSSSSSSEHPEQEQAPEQITEEGVEPTVQPEAAGDVSEKEAEQQPDPEPEQEQAHESATGELGARLTPQAPEPEQQPRTSPAAPDPQESAKEAPVPEEEPQLPPVVTPEQVPEATPEHIPEAAPIPAEPEQQPEPTPEPVPEQERPTEHADHDEGAERGPSVSSSGDGQEELERLREECEEAEREHLEMLGNIDKVMLELRESETELMQLVVEESEYIEATEAQCKEGERYRAVNATMVIDLQDELNRLEQEAVASASEERQLASQYASLTSQAERLERRIEDEELLTSKQSYKETVELLHQREDRLRELEDRILTVDDMIEDQAKALERLRQEHSGLSDVRNMTCSSAEEELRESRKVSEQLERTLSRLLQRRNEARAKHGGAQSTVASMDENVTSLQELRRSLEDELKEKTAVRNAAEESLDAYIEQVIGGSGTNMRLEKINEVMMMLKGKAINLGSDHAFIGEVHTSYLDDPMGGFNTGFGYVRSYIVAAHGEQRQGARWVLDQTKEPTYDEVENLLTAIKQMIVCYDLLPVAAKREVPVTREVIRNGGNLVYLAEICSLKYAELMEEKRLKMIEEETERQLRIKRSLAPKLPGRGYSQRVPGGASSPSCM